MSQSESTNAYHLLFPDVRSAIGFVAPSVNSIQKDAVYVLDTNTLLLPYKLGHTSFALYQTALRQLAQAKRLIIPGHVLREFLVNRPVVLADLIKSLAATRGATEQNPVPPVMLSELVGKGVLSSFKTLQRAQADFQSQVGKMIDTLVLWQDDDPVIKFVRELIADPTAMVDLDNREAEEAAKEFKSRCARMMPPGFKDEKKAINSDGDYLVWKVILKTARARQCHTIFISQDAKSDWLYSVDKRRLFPRIELQHEHRLSSGGKSFYLQQVSEMLEINGASFDVVLEVERAQQLQHHPGPGMSGLGWTPLSPDATVRAETAVLEWATQKFGRKPERNDNLIPYQYSVAAENGKQIEIRIMTGDLSPNLAMMLYRHLEAVHTYAMTVTRQERRLNACLIVVLLSEAEAREVVRYAVRNNELSSGTEERVFGFVNERGFVPVHG